MSQPSDEVREESERREEVSEERIALQRFVEGLIE